MAAALFLLSLLLILSSPLPAAGEPAQDRAALLDFVARVPHSPRLAWNATASACDWSGVTCDANRTAVQRLRLPGYSFGGPIPPNTLSRLSHLRVLSLHSNALSGAVPDDLSLLPLLRSLYLHNNLLSGGIPVSIALLPRLSRLDLSGNDLSGEIPPELTNLERLTGLFLQNNRLSGAVPSVAHPGLVDLNVSGNRLTGLIPAAMERFPESSFRGNLDLCGAPLPPCGPPLPPPPFSPPLPLVRKKRRISTLAIVAIAAALVGVFLLLLLLLLIFLAIRWRGGGATSVNETKGAAAAPAPVMEMDKTSSDEAPRSGRGDGREENRLVFVGDDGGYSFGLEDLLRASAEVMGKGRYGSSYRAVLEDGTAVAVKRLNDVGASRREFERHMSSLARARHPNILPYRAFYYSKDEKLLVSDLITGSLAALLHGGEPPLDWEARLSIATAVARGLAHLHGAVGVVHGSVKDSNVLVERDCPESAVLADYGLQPLFGEVETVESDVYWFGVVVLELLTGRAADQEGVGLASWVRSVVRDEWTAEVFDVELRGYVEVEEEMVELLHIALGCVDDAAESRPSAAELVGMVEAIGRRPELMRRSGNWVSLQCEVPLVH